MNARPSFRTHDPKLTDLRACSHTGTHWVECKINGSEFVWFFDTADAAERCRFGLEIAFGMHNTAKDSAADDHPEFDRTCSAADRQYQATKERAA